MIMGLRCWVEGSVERCQRGSGDLLSCRDARPRVRSDDGHLRPARIPRPQHVRRHLRADAKTETIEQQLLNLRCGHGLIPPSLPGAARVAAKSAGAFTLYSRKAPARCSKWR